MSNVVKAYKYPVKLFTKEELLYTIVGESRKAPRLLSTYNRFGTKYLVTSLKAKNGGIEVYGADARFVSIKSVPAKSAEKKPKDD